MKRTNVFGCVICVRNVVLHELGKVVGDVIDEVYSAEVTVVALSPSELGRVTGDIELACEGRRKGGGVDLLERDMC